MLSSTCGAVRLPGDHVAGVELQRARLRTGACYQSEAHEPTGLTARQGLFVTFGMGLITLYTSYVLWQYVMDQLAKGERCLDICDIGYLLFNKSPIAYEATAMCVVLALAPSACPLTGMSQHAAPQQHLPDGLPRPHRVPDPQHLERPLAMLGPLLGHHHHHRHDLLYPANPQPRLHDVVDQRLLHVPRRERRLLLLASVSRSLTPRPSQIFLALLFAGIEDNPLQGYGGYYPTLGPVSSRAFPVNGTTFVAGMGGFLNM